MMAKLALDGIKVVDFTWSSDVCSSDLSGRPALIDCVIDPTDGTESGHLTHLNPVGVEQK